MRRLSEKAKFDIALVPQIVSANGTTTKYVSLKDCDRAIFGVAIHFTGCTTTTTAGQTSANTLATSVVTLYQAKNGSAGTSGTAMASGTALMSFNTKVTEFAIIPGVCSAADTVSITGYDVNGDARTALTFTAEDGGTSASTASTSRYFSINDTAGGTALISSVCTKLAAILNDVTYGVPDLYATASSTNVTCRPINIGDNVFTFTSSTTTNMTLLSSKVIGFVQVNASALTLSSDFTHVAVNVTNETALLTTVWVTKEGRKTLMPVQRCAAITTVGE